MAKKRKKRAGTRRRRRIGALGRGKINWNETLMDAAGLGVGAFSANMVNKGIEKMLPKANDKVKAALPLLVGGAAMVYGRKNALIRNAGAGLFAVSVSGALKSFGIGNAPVADNVDEFLNQLADAQRQETEDGSYTDMGNAPVAGTNDVGLPD